MSSIEERQCEKMIRTAAAISGIFFFHSTSSEDLRDWFDINTTENLWVSKYSVLPPYDAEGKEGEMGGVLNERIFAKRKERKKMDESAPRIMGLL